MYLKQKNYFIISLIICLNISYLKIIQANSLFRFGFDISINENSFKTSFKITDGEEKEESFMTTSTESTTTTTIIENNFHNTESPVTVTPTILADIWSKQAQLNATANNKLQATRIAVTQLKNDVLVVVGRSDFIAAKVKLMTRYLNKVNDVIKTNRAADAADAAVDDNNNNGGAEGAGHDAAAANRFLILQDYVQLVDDLRTPPTSEEGGERSLDYMVMKLGLEKHKLIELQTQILVEVLQAMETWQTYVKKQLVDVVTV
ncbi:uncharacterized protein ACRADG_000697 isoform 3-T3 [Cochliomyia hominivorax]